MTTLLSPAEAAEFAQLVYNTENGAYSKVDLMPYRANWNFNPAFCAIQASSGTARVMRKTTGFCTIATGNENTVYKNHVLVMARGTSSKFDIATDVTLGLKRSSSGHMVHMGFQTVFQEILQNGLSDYFARSQIATMVHCVGHSLGGALVTMIAEWLATNRKAGKVALYTFGSPRVGLCPYSEHVQDKLGADYIFRVFHAQDPVAMVPLWPFMHVPVNSLLRLGGDGGFIAPRTHLLASYTSYAISSSNWDNLAQNCAIPPTESALKQWLTSKDFPSFTGATLNMLQAAIAWVFGEILKQMAINVQAQFMVGMTVLDQIAMVLHQGIKAGIAISQYVRYLLEKILALLGRKVSALAETPTVAFIRATFNDLQRKLNREVSNALSVIRKER